MAGRDAAIGGGSGGDALQRFVLLRAQAFQMLDAVLLVAIGILPLIVALAVVPLGLTGVHAQAAVLEGAMPSQLLSFIIAGKFKLDEETMAFVIMVDTVLAFVTLPLIRALLLAT